MNIKEYDKIDEHIKNDNKKIVQSLLKSKDFAERMVGEYIDLCIKKKSLYNFIHQAPAHYQELGNHYKNSLAYQHAYMEDYAAKLREQLAWLHDDLDKADLANPLKAEEDIQKDIKPATPQEQVYEQMKGITESLHKDGISGILKSLYMFSPAEDFQTLQEAAAGIHIFCDKWIKNLDSPYDLYIIAKNAKAALDDPKSKQDCLFGYTLGDPVYAFLQNTPEPTQDENPYHPVLSAIEEAEKEQANG